MSFSVKNEASFIKSAARLSQCPFFAQGEIAFIGRSNVGKSSLLNTLLSRRDLVKTSKTPGQTQLMNYFMNIDKQVFVDLPGYGYARVPGAIKKQINEMITTYLTQRDALRAVFLLIDSRRGELSEDDQYFLELCLSVGRQVAIVLTKIDKLNKGERTLAIKKMATLCHKEPQDLLVFSALNKEGLDKLVQTVNFIYTAPMVKMVPERQKIDSH